MQNFSMNSLVIQKVEVIPCVKNLAVAWIDAQLTQIFAMGAGSTVQSNQQVAKRTTQWVVTVLADGGHSEVVIHAL